MRALEAVGRGVDADDGVAGAKQETVENARGDGAHIVGRMVGLQPHRQAAGKPDCVAEARHHRALRRHHHQILAGLLILADRRRHLWRDAGRELGQLLRCGAVGEEPVAQSADGEMGDGRRTPRWSWPSTMRRVTSSDCRARRDCSRKLASGTSASANCAATRSSPARRRDAGERIAAAGRRSFRQQRLEVGKDVAAACDRRAVHARPRRFTRIIAQRTVDAASAHSAAAGSGTTAYGFSRSQKGSGFSFPQVLGAPDTTSNFL